MYIYINYAVHRKARGLKSLETPLLPDYVVSAGSTVFPAGIVPPYYTIAEINPASMAITSSAAIAAATIF